MSIWQRQRNWWNEVVWKPKKAHSLEQLKYQHQVLLRNPVVTEANKNLLVETFRSIAEILIWGDQNDSRVFDFFLEKNMQQFFLKTLSQRCGRFVCLQLLQTLSILYENIRNETSIYYLLSNNHVNSLIVLKLDFSDEEVLAYYISFLKTLSFKLNTHTIHFFYNEHLRDFPLYTEAIKFFNHSESMVRIAVRTLTLNVYKVNDTQMLEYVCNKTAAPYFSNLVWFIGNHIIELDECLLSQAHHLNRGHLEELVAEHLDHLYYIKDILSLGVDSLNTVLTDQLLNRLLIPLYVFSITDHSPFPEGQESPRISSTVALFLLAQVFLILSDPAVVLPLAHVILTGDTSLSLPDLLKQSHLGHRRDSSLPLFAPPPIKLNQEMSLRQPVYVPAPAVDMRHLSQQPGVREDGEGSSTESLAHMRELTGHPVVTGYVDHVVDSQYPEYVVIEASPKETGEEVVATPRDEAPTRCMEEIGRTTKSTSPPPLPPASSHPYSHTPRHNLPITSTIFLDALMNSLSVRTDDQRCLFALCLLYALIQNKGVHQKLLEAFYLVPTPQDETDPPYNSELMCLLLALLDTATATGNSIRLVTHKLAIMLLEQLLGSSTCKPTLQDHHIALVESVYEAAILQLRLFYKGSRDEIFLDMFEDEYNNEGHMEVKVLYLLQEGSMLLPPTDTPLTGIEFTRRLPCGETERARKAMRVFFATRRLSQKLQGQSEKELPLTNPSNSATIGDIVDLNNCDLVSCYVTTGEKSVAHFMVVTESEFLLVDPDKNKIGWGVVHFIAFLQDVDVTTDPANSCALFLTVHSHIGTIKRPALSAKFQFEDHIRCVAARQCLQRNKENLRLAKMTRVAKLLHLPVPEAVPERLKIPHLQSPEHLDAGSFIAIPTPQSSSTDISHSAIHHQLQQSLPSGMPTEDIEMIQLQSVTDCAHPRATHLMATEGEDSTTGLSPLGSPHEPLGGIRALKAQATVNESPRVMRREGVQIETHEGGKTLGDKEESKSWTGIQNCKDDRRE